MTPHAARRASDTSFWIRSSEVFEKYKLLVYFIAWFLIALGFDFKLPGQQIKSMQSQVDSLKTSWKSLQEKEDVQLRLWCASRSVTDTERDLAGLVCAKPKGGK